MYNRLNLIEEQERSTPVSGAWRRRSNLVSLPESHRSIVVPPHASFWRKLAAFSGPGFLVAVGYMDPGNWATDLAGGARFGYTLLCVILISNFIAMLLQHLCIKLGVVTERDLAQACRDHYSKATVIFLWLGCEVAIAACDLAEVVGSAIALQLLFGIPLVWGCLITAADVLAVLYLQHKGFRRVEAIVTVLIATIAFCFASELFLSKPHLPGVLAGFVPHKKILADPAMLYLAIGILGATVMPHNLYLHSSIVQTRKFERTGEGMREAIKFGTIDSSAALMFALFINAAILVLAASAFHWSGHQDVAEIQDAFRLLSPLLGYWRGQRALRRGPSRFGSKFHAHRNTRGSDCDGRFSQFSHRALAPTGDHARTGDYSRSGGHRHFWRKRNDAVAHRESGGSEHATWVRHLAVAPFHRRKEEDGRIRERYFY